MIILEGAQELLTPPAIARAATLIFLRLLMFRSAYLAFALFVAGGLPAQGQTALTDLGTGLYLGQYEGGLYPGGVNAPPTTHQAAARFAASSTIVPRDAFGMPAAQGLIGFASVSMSNANQEWAAFKRRVDQDDHRNSRVVLVSGAQGGQSLDVIANPGAPYWAELDARIEAAGLTALQVQVVWLKMADANPPTLAFPAHAKNAKANAAKVVRILKRRYPNLAIAFFSSRSYGGYAAAANRSEPLSYETGFATKWLIQDQITGLPNLNHDPANGPVVAPLLLWGPYLWTNGITPRADGLIWLPSDLEADMVHPSADGEAKVADMLEYFFQNAPAATPWYSAPVQERLDFLEATDDAWVDSLHPATNHGSEDYFLVMGGRRTAYMKFDLSGLAGQVKRAELCFNTHPLVLSEHGLKVHQVSNSSWSEATITYNTAPPLQGLLQSAMPELSRGTAVSVDVTAEVLAALGGEVSFAFTGTQGSLRNKVFVSHEGGEAPRLVLTMLPPCDDPGVPYCWSEPNSSGAPGLLTVSGSASLTQNNMVLTASQLPIGERAIFFFGLSSQHSPFGDGLLCVTPPVIAESQGVTIDHLGTASFQVDLSRLPLVVGNIVYVQCAYRDPLGGPVGYNLTDGLLITLCP